MKLIIPMAGKGTRLRPHSLTTPKPLLPVAGISIVERIVLTFNRTINRSVDEIAFVLGDFGDDVKKDLAEMAARQGAKASFFYQKEAKGTAHAIHCAKEALEGEIIVVFADTLFDTRETVDVDGADSVIWLKHVADPSRFGVAVHNPDGRITGFVEKPKELISNLAIIGVYYFKDGAGLRKEIEHLLDHNITGVGGEFQLTDAIDALLKQGKVFKAATVDEWLDCGTVPAWLETTSTIIAKEYGNTVPAGAYPRTVIHPPVYIGDGAVIEGSEIGPNASIGAGCVIRNSRVRDSIVLDKSVVEQSELANSTIGTHARVTGFSGSVNLSDHSVVNAVI
jgi:glucose-1-phosphate thymidylyltransferase